MALSMPRVHGRFPRLAVAHAIGQRKGGPAEPLLVVVAAHQQVVAAESPAHVVSLIARNRFGPSVPMHDLAAMVDEVHPGFKRIHHRIEGTGIGKVRHK